MLAVVLLASALLFGLAAVRLIPVPLYPIEHAALAVVIGLFGWTWIAFLACLALPYRWAVPLAVLIAAALSVLAWWRTRSAPPRRRVLPGARDCWLWAVVAAALALLFGRLFWTHSLVDDPTGVYSASSTWADFGLHAALVNHLAAPEAMPGDLPVASGEPLTYPFLIDLLSALLLRAGTGLHLSLFVPGLLLALAICQLVICFGLRLFEHLGGAVLGLFLVLTTGTAAGLGAAWADWRGSGEPLLRFLTDLPDDYTTLGERNGNVTNLVAHAMLPQRSILFGLGVALTVFILLQCARTVGPLLLVVPAGVLVGLLPMAHPHTFLVCLGVLTVHAADEARRRRGVPFDHLVALVLALGLAGPQITWQQLSTGHGTGGRFRWAWMREDAESVWSFWWTNFGFAGVFFLLLTILLVVRRQLRELLAWWLPFAAVLTASQLYVFQPFEYDNLKLIYYVYLMAGLLAAHLAVLAWRSSRWHLVGVVPVLVAVTVPGALSITREFQLRDQFADADGVALAAWVRAATDPHDVFIGTDRPNSPVAALGGRPVVLGYRGWLYNFSVPYAEREAAVRAALTGEVDTAAVRRFAPDYVVINGREGEEWTVDRDALGALPVAYRNDSWTVYRVTAEPVLAAADPTKPDSG